MAEPLRFPPPPLAGPARRGPLGPLAERLDDLPKALCLDAVPFPGQILLQAWQPDEPFAAAVAGVLGVAPPVEPGSVARGEDVEILGLADRRWLVVTPGGREEVLHRRLRQALDGQVAAVVDVTDARAVFHLAGPLAREVLAKGGALAWGADEPSPGWCAESRLIGVEAILQSTDSRPDPRGGPDQPCFRLYVPTCAARFVVAWIADAVAEH